MLRGLGFASYFLHFFGDARLISSPCLDIVVEVFVILVIKLSNFSIMICTVVIMKDDN